MQAVTRAGVQSAEKKRKKNIQWKEIEDIICHTQNRDEIFPRTEAVILLWSDYIPVKAKLKKFGSHFPTNVSVKLKCREIEDNIAVI